MPTLFYIYIYGMKTLLKLCIVFLSLDQMVFAQEYSFTTKDLKLTISSLGKVTELMDISNSTNYAQGMPPAIVSIMVNKEIIAPSSASYNSKSNILHLSFPNGATAKVKVISKPSHFSFELSALKSVDYVEAVVWGPYSTILNKSVGETIGVVQNDDYTLGILGLNPKTLGGYPWNDNDHMPQVEIYAQENFDVYKKSGRGVLYSVEAAKPTPEGSSLQAFTRNRDKDREIQNWGFPKFIAPAYNDGGLIGSKIAIYGTKTSTTLDRIGEIEVAEGLPHPMIDGQWIKKSRIINASYLIVDFSEDNIDQVLDITQKVGFNYLYHGDPFETWGHYPLRKKYFPNGLSSLKKCVEKANQKNIQIGTHTLTNFINTDDAYVSPIPDKRLAKLGYSKLTNNIGKDQSEITVYSNEPFKHYEKSNLKAIQIGNEIIRFGTVTEQAPYVLTDCQRGDFGTTAAEHKTDDEVAMLLDHGYKVFLGNAALNKEIAENIADIFNETGIRMLDFDGHEGTHSTGMGNYGEALFAKHWYDRLNDSIKKHFVLGSSRSGHFFWHYYSRMNWGEPWYAGFRESQTEYRLLNQVYFKRNYMPGMLGWFKMTPYTTIEDIHWLMARSAGYNAGFALVTDLETINKNGYSAQIMAAMKLWEQSRLKGLFSKEQESRMQGVKTEFRLSQNKDNTLSLTEVFSDKFVHTQKTVQPGEPVYSTFEFDHQINEQPLKFIITATDADASSIEMEIDNYKSVHFEIKMNKGDVLKYEGGNTAIHYSKTWQKINEFPIDPKQVMLKSGKHRLHFSCQFENPDDKPSIHLETMVEGNTEIIKQR